MSPRAPIEVHLHQASRTLELVWDGGERCTLSCEYLRVHSPSAEVRGHGPGQEVLQTGKRLVTINTIESVGNYALQFRFSDGHDSGIYAWEYLYTLCQRSRCAVDRIPQRLAAAGASREPVGPVLIARQS
jgi:DUF971 family protein